MRSWHVGAVVDERGSRGHEVDIKGLIEQIVRALVDHPEQVKVTEIEGTHSVVLELSVAPDDVGKVIGKKGIHADAIRRLVHAIGGKTKKRYVLEILEDR
ncbi:MAG: KH domain-containing protein [Deltaproteobacteria bacterium]|nr:KH domain-containing protein [Deltaproteobacteria bacterium]